MPQQQNPTNSTHSKSKNASSALWRGALRKFRVSVRHIRRREVLTYAGFVLIAFFFWVMTTAYEETDATYTVRLAIDGQPDNRVFTTPVAEEIKVSVRDNNFQLLSYYYGGVMKELRVDFNRYADLGGNFRISAAELDALIKAELQPSTQITAITPSLVDARYAVAEGKRVPVRLNMDFRPAPDHRMGRPEVTPDSVTVHAPAAVLDTLTILVTQPLRRFGLTDTLDEVIHLELPLGVNATPDSLRLVLPVSQYVERTFAHVPVRTEYVPDGVRLNLFPYAVQVVCQVEFGAYRELSADDFELSVSYLDIYTRHQQKLPIHLRYNNRDERVAGVRLVPDSVEYVIEKL